MKLQNKIYLALVLLGVGFPAWAQYQSNNIVLVEEFTNQGCTPCAAFAPCLDSCISRHLTDVAFLTYHVGFPSASDHIYVLNKEQNESRFAYYGLSGVPTIVFNGEVGSAWAGHPEALDQQIELARKQSDFKLAVNASISNGRLTVNTDVTPLGDKASANIRLITAAVEDYVAYDHKVWNGESHWNYVMRQLLPDAEGQPIKGDLQANVTHHYSCYWDINGFDNADNLGIISFLQDADTKQVLAAVYTPRPTGDDNAAKIFKVLTSTGHICSPHFACKLVIRNTGKNVLTSAAVNVSVNGSVQTTKWEGDLKPLTTDTLETSDFTDFQVASGSQDNQVEIWLSNINNTEEVSPRVKLNVQNAVVAQSAVRLMIRLDDKPEETTWKLFNSAGEMVEQGGPYNEAGKRIYHTFALDIDDCYQLEFHDSGNNGIGKGYYKLDQLTADGKTKLLVQDSYTGAEATVNFSLEKADVSLGLKQPAITRLQSHKTYDLQGRKVDGKMQKGIVIKENKKFINR